MQAGLGDHALGIAELQDQGLLRLLHGEERTHQEHHDESRRRASADQEIAVHCCCPPLSTVPLPVAVPVPVALPAALPGVVAGARPRRSSSGSGR